MGCIIGAKSAIFECILGILLIYFRVYYWGLIQHYVG